MTDHEAGTGIHRMAWYATGGNVVESSCGLGFAAALGAVDAEIAARGLTVFARVDHAANARAVGLGMPPTTVIVFGNARGGTPLMLRAPGLALDLPLRILVRESSEGTVVSYQDPTAMVTAFGLPPSSAQPLLVLPAIAAGVSRAGPKSGVVAGGPALGPPHRPSDGHDPAPD